jgi:uncharacterized protein YecT (DUF1311 family)
MTTDPAGQPWDGTTYRGFSGQTSDAAPTPRGPRGWSMSRTLVVGVGGAVVLGLVLGVLARPTLNRSAAAPPMRAVTAAEDNTPARMDIEVNALPPQPIVRSAGRLDVLPPGAAQAASRPAPFLAGLSVEPPQSAQVVAADGCQAIHDRAAQMVCADPELSAADRELNQAYRRALRSGAAPEQLQQDQRDWLAIREDAARRSPRAVASIYEQRIDELNEIADEGPG